MQASVLAPPIGALSSISIGRMVAILLLLAAAFDASVFAQSITYMLFIHRMNAPVPIGSVGPTGTVNAVPFGANDNAVMTFVFHGDSSTVVPWSFGGSHGYENVDGTALFQINDSGTGNRLARGTFAPSAGIFVSTDTQFGGAGFGSEGGLPGSTAFPGNPVYPYALVVGNSYDLTGPTMLGPFNAGESCINFPFVCAAPIPLETSVGDLVVNNNGNGQLGFFVAMPGTVNPFSNFLARSTVDAATGRFSISGRLRPGSHSYINPTRQPVTLLFEVLLYNALWELPVTIPAGSFRQVSEGNYLYHGSVQGGTIRMAIRSVGENTFSFSASGTTTNLLFPYFPITPAPDAFFLSIGESAGETVPAN